MKQLDFFFDLVRSAFGSPSQGAAAKTLVFGGKREAQEILTINGRKVRVRRKSYQRNLGLTLRPSGELVVTASRSVTLKIITRFVTESWRWVEEQQQKFEVLRLRFPIKEFVPGEYFSVLGMQYALRVETSSSKRPDVRLEGSQLVVSLPEKLAISSDMQQNFLRTLIRNYYEQLGKRVLSERILINSQKLQLYPQSLSFRCQKTRWGSCSPNGHISLNWRLVAAPQEVIDYVVIHELCHLKHPNHSSSFWQMVEQYSPRCKKIRHWLNENQFSFDFLSENSELYPGNF